MKSVTAPRKVAMPVDPKDAEIADLRAQLERARDEMRAFSYSVSHDLRAPLRAIEGFGRILSEDYSSKLDEDGKRFLDHVLHNAQVMGSLIEDLLTFHRLNEKPFGKKSVDLREMLTDVFTTAAKPRPDVKVEIGNLPKIQADPVMVRVACEHLVANALKFSKRHASPEITVGSERGDGETILWIKDNGIGFDMQYADKLFTVFQKLQKEPDFDGNGIGLSIVRRIAEKHGGRVWVKAAPNDGATFYLAIPNA